MAGKFIRGALVEFMPTFLIPLPNVIIFQFNPETMTHSWTPASPLGGDSSGKKSASGNPLAVRGRPGESFSFALEMDAGDTIADGSKPTAAIATATGIYSRLAALEMLLQPMPAGGGGLLGAAAAAAGALGGGGKAKVNRTVPSAQIPTVLFVWGPGRILPVRVTNLSITEKQYDRFLSPTRAEAQIGLQVLTPDELAHVSGPLGPIAKGAYKYSEGLRQALALSNLAYATESVIGMLPH